MITFEVQKLYLTEEVIAYHFWDIPENAIIHKTLFGLERPNEGEYYKFNDGSELYTIIKYVAKEIVVTNMGTLRRKDIVNVARPKGKWTNYSGVRKNYESFFVRRSTQLERNYAKGIIRSTNIPKYVGDRVKVLTMDILRTAISQSICLGKEGITSEDIVQRLIDLGFNEPTNTHTFKAIQAIAFIMGVEILPSTKIVAIPPVKPLAGTPTPYEIVQEKDDRIRNLNHQIKPTALITSGSDKNLSQLRPGVIVPNLKKIKETIAIVKNEMNIEI